MNKSLNTTEQTLKYRVGKDNQGVVLYLTEQELEDLHRIGYAGRSQYTNQQWAKIRKILKKVYGAV